MRHLLIIDTTGNVMLAGVDNDIRMPIGEPLAREQQSQVTTAVWSPQGQWTTWSVDSAEIDGVRQVRFHDEDTDKASVLVESVSAFYMCPSPNGRWLSHLSPGPLGLELAISDVASGEVHIAERGQPMFWSWSPDSSQLAVHVENRVLITDHLGQFISMLTVDAGPFVTPWWLPGGAVLFGLDERVMAGGLGDELTTVVDRGCSGRFSLDPEGRRLAYIDTSNDDAALVVLDLLSLTKTEISAEQVVAFFWSPDGSRLAVVTATGDGLVQWIVADGPDTHRLTPFSPTRRWATSVLPFFEQYAQSHACWSGDGTRLLAPAVDDQGQSGALIQAADSSGHSQWIPDADLAWWA